MPGTRDGEDAWPPTNPDRASTRIGFDTEFSRSAQKIRPEYSNGFSQAVRMGVPESMMIPMGIPTRMLAYPRRLLSGEPTRDKYLIVDGGALAGTGAHSYTSGS